MAQIIMYWDRITPLGDPQAGIEIVSNQPIEIPANACGFRLGRHGEACHDPWHFAAYNSGSVFSVDEVVYSSSYTGTVQCPGELLISAAFHKNPSASPATVKYRFRFIHGPVSTVFSRLVDEDGVAVTHAVPIPLSPPIDDTPVAGGRGGDVASGTIVIVTRPEEPPFPTPPTPIVPPALKQFKGVPTNVHRSRVRLEVINASEGVITSNWARYHIVCVPGPVGRGARGSAVTRLQSRLNRWARDHEMAQIVVDGVFGPRTVEAVRTVQHHHRLNPGGQVGPVNWERLTEV